MSMNYLFRVARYAAFGGLLFSSSLLAATFNLEQGQTKMFKTKEKIDTIFVSSPNVADYEVLDDNTFIIYAKAEGKSEVVALDENGTALTNDVVNVNNFINHLSDTNNQIKIRFPNSKLQVKKVGKAYVIEGEAKSANELEEVNRLVGEALGASKKVTEASIKRDSGDEKLPFLDKYQYDGVVNTAHIEDHTQINVKLTVVEVNKKFSDALGINWSNLQGNFFKNLSNLQVSGSFGSGGGSLALINANNLNLFINALDNQDNGRILSEPNISMLSGETADILVGGELPFMQRSRDGEVNVIYKDFGVKLLVGAKIQKNDRIRLVLAQEVSTIAGNYNSNDITVPYFNTRRSKSTFEVADGESFILGGLLSKEDLEGIAKVPVLGDVPILGSLFRRASTNRESKELVIVATVNLVKPVNSEEIVYPDFETTGTMERFFNTSSFKNLYHKTLTTNFLKNGGFIQ
ncbi:MAG: type II and III secretion system protein family protein [Pasteurellaceae bacterium]|nr:type II and III secretion system protein family protein [Pasteurellaceae bacterium]